MSSGVPSASAGRRFHHALTHTLPLCPSVFIRMKAGRYTLELNILSKHVELLMISLAWDPGAPCSALDRHPPRTIKSYRLGITRYRGIIHGAPELQPSPGCTSQGYWTGRLTGVINGEARVALQNRQRAAAPALLVGEGPVCVGVPPQHWALHPLALPPVAGHPPRHLAPLPVLLQDLQNLLSEGLF